MSAFITVVVRIEDDFTRLELLRYLQRLLGFVRIEDDLTRLELLRYLQRFLGADFLLRALLPRTDFYFLRLKLRFYFPFS